MKQKLKELGFYEWFDDYSQVNHHLSGWREYDQYLDEVELPEILFLTLVQKWLREEYRIDILVQSDAGLENKSLEWCYVLKQLPSEEIINKVKADEMGEDWDLFLRSETINSDWYLESWPTYEQALENGINESLKLI